jgi:hypothetical protein
MKKISIVITLLCIAMYANSQSEIPIKRNTIYGELFGQGLYNSISFDRLYRMDKKVKSSFTAGFSLFPSDNLFVFGLPISYNLLVGKKNHFMELGLGFTTMYEKSEIFIGVYNPISNQTSNKDYFHTVNFYTYFTPKFGYRYQRANGGFFFRTTFTPFLAGINRIGYKTKRGIGKYSRYEYFDNAVSFGEPVFPWVGVGIGYTF